MRGLFTALSDPAGVIAHRAGALERVQLLLENWHLTRTRLTQAEQRMTAVLDELGLTALVTSITGLSPVSAAAILAETGDPRRFATARALAGHAGLARREKPSGAFTGRTRLTGQGRPGLRLAAPTCAPSSPPARPGTQPSPRTAPATPRRHSPHEHSLRPPKLTARASPPRH